MVAWVVAFCSPLRRSGKSSSFCVLHPSPRFAFAFSGRIPFTFSDKSFSLKLFADPHPLTLVAPIFYIKVWGEGLSPLDVQIGSFYPERGYGIRGIHHEWV